MEISQYLEQHSPEQHPPCSIMVDQRLARLTRTKVMMTSKPNAMPFVTPVYWQVHHQIQAEPPV